MSLKQYIDGYENFKRSIYTRCKQLNAPIAIVGTNRSAVFLLETIEHGDILIRGVFETEKFRNQTEFKGYPVRPLQELKELDSEDVVIIASSAEATDLYETFMAIQSCCRCKVIHLKTLLDVYLLMKELKEPLQFKFDQFLFGRGFANLDYEDPYWHPVPPDVDFSNKTVLELGPFEGNNSVMLMGFKPKKVIGLEGRPLNFAKVSVIKALYGWENYSLILGDMHVFPQLVKEKIDIIFCSGVFYHSPQPWWLLKTCMEHCDTIVLCGHISSEHSTHQRRFQEVSLESGRYRFEIYPECGDDFSGLTNHSLWFKEDDLIHFLDYYGFTYKKYHSTVNSTGLWIFSVVIKK